MKEEIRISEPLIPNPFDAVLPEPFDPSVRPELVEGVTGSQGRPLPEGGGGLFSAPLCLCGEGIYPYHPYEHYDEEEPSLPEVVMEQIEIVMVMASEPAQEDYPQEVQQDYDGEAYQEAAKFFPDGCRVGNDSRGKDKDRT